MHVWYGPMEERADTETRNYPYYGAIGWGVYEKKISMLTLSARMCKGFETRQEAQDWLDYHDRRQRQIYEEYMSRAGL